MKPAERDAKKAELLARLHAFVEKEGVVPGIRQFIRETGEKKHLWDGHLWASWSAFVVEAGLQPQELTPARDDASMLRPVADLTRTLGRLPTAREMTFERTSGGEIAADKTYRNRFRSRDALAAATMEWAAKSPGYGDVERILAAALVDRRRLDDAGSGAAPPPATADAELVGLLDDSYVPPIVACLPALAAGTPVMIEACERRGVSAHVEFERRVAAALRLLGLEVSELGQGAGRVADGIAHCRAGRWALVYDAKLRRSGFAMGTEDRKFR